MLIVNNVVKYNIQLEAATMSYSYGVLEACKQLKKYKGLSNKFDKKSYNIMYNFAKSRTTIHQLMAAVLLFFIPKLLVGTNVGLYVLIMPIELVIAAFFFLKVVYHTFMFLAPSRSNTQGVNGFSPIVMNDKHTLYTCGNESRTYKYAIANILLAIFAAIMCSQINNSAYSISAGKFGMDDIVLILVSVALFAVASIAASIVNHDFCFYSNDKEANIKNLNYQYDIINSVDVKEKYSEELSSRNNTVFYEDICNYKRNGTKINKGELIPADYKYDFPI